MWIAKFYDCGQKQLPDLDTNCEEEAYAIEFVDAWLRDAKERARYELVWKD